jgi:hypothetical protein
MNPTTRHTSLAKRRRAGSGPKTPAPGAIGSAADAEDADRAAPAWFNRI